MRHILNMALVVTGLIATLVLVGLSPVRQRPIATFQPVAQEFLPGQLMPSDVTCRAAYYFEDHVHLYCQPLGDFRASNVFFTYDRMEKIIVHTDVLDPPETAGELILAWGDPVGYRQQAMGRYLYWPGRYVYFGGLEFSPNAKVGFIAYDDAIISNDAWRGFTN